MTRIESTISLLLSSSLLLSLSLGGPAGGIVVGGPALLRPGVQQPALAQQRPPLRATPCRPALCVQAGVDGIIRRKLSWAIPIDDAR